jgi:eukaryotic-like serine/threonine-protein kinase
VIGCAAVHAEYSASENRPKIGDLICGKYRITAVLGRGGMGVVFEALHRVTEKRFALKWLLPELAESPEGRRRFVREAKAASRLRHPSVVEIYDIEQERGWFFLVMELLLGESLETRLARVGALSISDGCSLLLPCMRAIAQAHAVGIVHRDLKPANLFLCSATDERLEFAKVLDFGISRMTGDLDTSEVALTQSGALMGTPNYMAPEQLRAGAVDHGADIYAFGVILYEAFAGRRPFSGASIGELVLKIMSDQPPPLHEVNPTIDPRVSAIVHRALERRPEDRFATMSEFARALELREGTSAGQSARVSSEPDRALGTTSLRRSLAGRGGALGLTGASAGLVLVCFAIAWRDSVPPGNTRTIAQPLTEVPGTHPPTPTSGLDRAAERMVIPAPAPIAGVGTAPQVSSPGPASSAETDEQKTMPVKSRPMLRKKRRRGASTARTSDEASAAPPTPNPYRAGPARSDNDRPPEPSSSSASPGRTTSDISVDDF